MVEEELACQWSGSLSPSRCPTGSLSAEKEEAQSHDRVTIDDSCIRRRQRNELWDMGKGVELWLIQEKLAPGSYISYRLANVWIFLQGIYPFFRGSK